MRSGSFLPRVASSSHVEPWLYAIDNGASDGSGTLYRLGTTPTGGAVGLDVVGETGVQDIFDIAFLGNRLFGIGPGFESFGTSDDVLIEIDPATGSVSPVGSIDVSGNFNSLAGETASTLIGATTRGEVWRLNPDALTASRIGTYGSGLVSSGDLALSPGGVLYGTADSGGFARLVTVNTSTGRASTVGSTGYRDVFGLAFHPSTGALLGVVDAESNPRLAMINPLNAATSILGRIPAGEEVTGLAVSPALPSSEDCAASSDAVFILGGRFRFDACWETRDGNRGVAKLANQQGTGATLWFFNSNNPELFVKVRNACVAPFNRHWVFIAGLTNVGVTVTVTDTQTGFRRTYSNPVGRAYESVQDTSSFATCP